MKIIKQADVSDWSYEYTCKSCDSVLQVDQNDIKFYYSSDCRENYSSETWTAVCPVCNGSFSVHESKIPKLVKIKIKEKDKNNISARSYWTDK